MSLMVSLRKLEFFKASRNYTLITNQIVHHVWGPTAPMTDPRHSLLLPLLTKRVSIFKALLVSVSSPAPFTEMLRLCVYSLSAADWHRIHSGMVSGLPEKSKLWQCAL